MARTKEFDPDAVLQKALELFRERGYEGTSMSDLVERLGIARASIYGTFGSKRDLYLKALDRYLEQGDLIERLSQPGPVLPAVRGVFEAYVEECLADELRRGCLVVNTAIELAPRDPGLARRVVASWDALETALTSALIRARAQGEIAADADPRGLARMLLMLLQGLRVLGRADPDPVRLRGAVDQAMATLR
ncbi:MAG TPA: TetR family transcriptional regulator [Thermomonospora sp.]|nr:TetR family transcriptional regulator [Thermomonospora sp.]